ncbi:MAG: hypothetical protein AAF738_08265 [Bacteroidota bacterium]
MLQDENGPVTFVILKMKDDLISVIADTVEGDTTRQKTLMFKRMNK